MRITIGRGCFQIWHQTKSLYRPHQQCVQTFSRQGWKRNKCIPATIEHYKFTLIANHKWSLESSSFLAKFKFSPHGNSLWLPVRVGEACPSSDGINVCTGFFGMPAYRTTIARTRRLPAIRQSPLAVGWSRTNRPNPMSAIRHQLPTRSGLATDLSSSAPFAQMQMQGNDDG